jgi:hypothetical protein
MIFLNSSVHLLSAGKCGMYFVEDNASDTVESSVSRDLLILNPDRFKNYINPA